MRRILIVEIEFFLNANENSEITICSWKRSRSWIDGLFGGRRAISKRIRFAKRKVRYKLVGAKQTFHGRREGDKSISFWIFAKLFGSEGNLWNWYSLETGHDVYFHTLDFFCFAEKKGGREERRNENRKKEGEERERSRPREEIFLRKRYRGDCIDPRESREWRVLCRCGVRIK